MMDQARPPAGSFTSALAGSGWPLRLAVLVLLILPLLGAGGTLAWRARRPAVLDCGAFVLTADPPVRTGHQRAERLSFADGGRLLAVACPRYGHVVLYRLDGPEPLREVADISTEGRPVAVRASRDRLYVLQRPAGLARHLEPAYWQTYDFSGKLIGSKFRVGFDPDDLALSDDGQLALVLLSGHAEGESNRPAPSLVVVDLSDPVHPRPRGSVSFDRPGEDPERLAVDRARGAFDRAAVSLRGSGEVAWIDLEDPDRPRIVARTALPDDGEPGPLVFDASGRLLVTDVRNGAVRVLTGEAEDPSGASPGPAGVADALPFVEEVGGIVQVQEPTGPIGEGRLLTVGLIPDGSALEVLGPSGRSLGQLRLAGAFGLGGVIPMDLAVPEEPPGASNILAVADRSGGIHLVRLRCAERAAPE